MRKNYWSAIGVIIALGIGASIWKYYSKPLPIIDSLPEDNEAVPPSPAQQASNLPELTVGNQTITPDDLKWELELHTAAPKFSPDTGENAEPLTIAEPNTPELRDRIVSSVLERKIAYLYITEKLKNFNSDDPSRFTKCLSKVNETVEENPDFFASRKNRERLKSKLCEQSVIEQYLDENVFSTIIVSSAEIASYYRTHEKEFKKPLRVSLRQIVVATREEAERLRKEVKPGNFSELARKHSITPEAPNGGLIGPFSKEQLPTLFDIVFSMGMGEISGIIKSEFGFHIIMPVERLPAQTLSLAEASGQIRAEIRRTKRLEAYQKWLSSAVNAISVTPTPSGI